MQIQNFDSLKIWLTNCLTPICDAEPAALAKYVIALLKKDKTDEELRCVCLEQLDVFLQENTQKFVATLFETIENKTYLATPDKEKIHEQVLTTQSKDSNKTKSHTSTTNKDKEHDKTRSVRGLSSTKRYRSRSPDNSHRNNKRLERGRLERDYIRRGSHRSRSPIHETGEPITSDASKVPSDNDYAKSKAPPVDSGIIQKARCRDFHEKGFCMRGDLCSFDHGTDPVVVDDMSKVIGYPTPNQAPVIDNRFICQPICSSQVAAFVGANTCPLNNEPPVSAGFLPSKRNVLTVPIIDDSTPRFVLAGQVQPIHHRDTQLSQMDLRNTLNNSANCNLNASGHRTAAHNRLDPQNCTLYIMRIPHALNNVGKLFEHFAKFGNIANIQVNPNTEVDTALVTFSSHHEALSAYRSPEPIFANRFIRIAFYDPTRLSANRQRQKQSQQPASLAADVGAFDGQEHKNVSNSSARRQSVSISQSNAAVRQERMRTIASHSVSLAGRLGNRISVKQRLGVLPSRSSAMIDSSDEEAAKAAEDSVRRPRRESLRSDEFEVVDNVQVLNSVEPSSKTVPPRVAATLNVSKASADKTTLRQVQQQVQQQMRVQKELRVKQVSLLQVYRKQMAALLIKLEKASSTADKRRIAADVKAVNIKVRDLEKELKLNKKTAQPQLQLQPISKKETQRQILDLEMEIYQKELSHEPVTELKKCLLELKRQVGGDKLLSRSVDAATANATSLPRQPRLPTASQTRLDKRPRVLYITGYEESQFESLMTELTVSGYHVTCKQEVVEERPMARVVFGSRAEAEQAFIQFQSFHGRALKLDWLAPNSLSKELLNHSVEVQVKSTHETRNKSAFKPARTTASSDTEDEDDHVIVSTNTRATAALISNQRLSDYPESSANILDSIASNEHIVAL